MTAAADTERIPAAAGGNASTANSDERSVPTAEAGRNSNTSSRSSVPSEAEANRNSGARSATSATPNENDSESVASQAKRARLEESREIKSIFKKFKVYLSNLRFSLEELSTRWAEYESDPLPDLKASLVSELDDTRFDLQQLMDLREQCCYLEDLDEDDDRVEALDVEIRTARREFKELRKRILPLAEESRADAASIVSAASSQAMQTMIPVYYPHYDPKKDGIVFSGTNSKDYSSFLIGWKTVESEFEKRNKPKIDLFRQLKKCLSGDPLELVKDIPETETAVDFAFDILNKYYKRPLDGILETYKALASLEKKSCKLSHNSFWELYKKYLAMEQARNLFELDSETEAALLMMAQASVTFTPEVEGKFKKYLLEHCHEPDTKLQYKISRATIADFLQYMLHTTEKEKSGEASNSGKRPRSDLAEAHVPERNKEARKRTLPATFSSTVTRVCLVCGKNHFTFNCYELRSRDPSWILQLTRKKNLCQACFKPFQPGHSCNIACTLPGCGGRHINRLHEVVLQREKEFRGGSGTSSPQSQSRFEARSSPGAGPSNSGFKSRYNWRKPQADSNSTPLGAKPAANPKQH